MPRDESISRVGLGVDLQGGEETVSLLRTIRSEMQGIVSLAANIPKNIGGQRSAIDPRQQTLDFKAETDKQGELFGSIQRQQTRVYKEQLTERQQAFKRQQDDERREIDKTARYKKQSDERNAAKRAPVTGADVDQRLGEIKRRQELNQRVSIEEQRALLAREGIHKRINDNSILTAKEREAQIAREREGIVNLGRYQEAATQRNRAATIRALQEEESLRQKNLTEAAIKEARLAEIRNRPRSSLGQFLSDDEIARQNRSNAARQRIAAQPRDASGRLVSRADAERQAAEEARAEAERLAAQESLQQRRLEASRRINDRVAVQEQQRAKEERARVAAEKEVEQRISSSGPNRAALSEIAGNRLDRRAAQSAATSLAQSERPILGPGREEFVDIERNVAGINKLTAANVRLRESVSRKIQFFEPGNEAQGRVILENMTQLQVRAAELKLEFQDVNRTRPLKTIEADLRSVERETKEQIALFEELHSAQLSSDVSQGILKRRPNLPSVRPNLNDPQGLLNEKGFFTSGDALGRITRNILLYEVVSRATYGLVSYVGEAVKAAKASTEFGNALRFATESSHGNLQANRDLAESFRPLGVTRQESQSIVTESAKFAESRPQDTDKIARLAVNLASTRGDGLEKTGELIESIRRGETKVLKRIFNTTADTIYENQATKVVDARPVLDQKLTIGRTAGDFKTRAEQIKEYVAAMTDAEKENAVFDYALSQSNRFQAEANDRAGTLAGKLDLVAAKFKDAQEGVGLFITEIKPVGDILSNLGNKISVLDRLRGPELKRTGLGGTISEADVRQFGIDKTTGPRASLLGAVNNFGVTGIASLFGIGAAGLAGRRNAQADYRRSEYGRLFEANKIDPAFEGNLIAAQNEAARVAKELKPGLLRSVEAGMSRFTNGLTQTITGLTGDASTVAIRTGRSYRAAVRDVRRGYAASFGPEQGELKNIIAGPFSSLDDRPRERVAGRGGIVGGLVGGAIGAEVGNLVAQSINAGPITATTLTILGGVAGTAIGTTVGNAAGTGITTALAGGGGATLGASVATAGIVATVGSVLAALGIGVGIGTIINKGIIEPLRFGNDERRLAREEASAGADAIRIRERNQANSEGRLFLRSNVAGSSSDLFTKSQVEQLVRDGRARPSDFAEEIVADVKSLSVAVRDRLAQEAFAESTKQLTGAARQQAQNAFGAKQDADFQALFTGKAGDEATKSFGQSEERRLAEEAKAKEKRDRAIQERINQQSNALAKLREAAQGSFRLVGDVGQNIAGTDNQFVKPLADQITVAERMRQQWGFLGKASVDYFTKVEGQSISLQLLKLRFDSLTKSMQLNNQAGREADERFGPGFSTRNNLGADIGSAAINEVRTRYAGYRQEADINGLAGPDPFRLAKDELSQVGIQGTLRGFGNGSSGRQIVKIVTDAQSEILNQFNPNQIRNDPYLKSVALENVRNRNEIASGDLSDAIRKARLQDNEDARLRGGFSSLAAKRNDLIAGGANRKDVLAEYDRNILNLTNGISQKDLTADQFEARQAALKNDARRTVEQEDEARRAIKEGVEVQRSMNKELQIIRTAILGGSVSMLVQVQNDTQARIDQNDLIQANGKNYNTPLDQSEVKVNPYSSSLGRYGRGGDKR